MGYAGVSEGTSPGRTHVTARSPNASRQSGSGDPLLAASMTARIAVATTSGASSLNEVSGAGRDDVDPVRRQPGEPRLRAGGEGRLGREPPILDQLGRDHDERQIVKAPGRAELLHRCSDIDPVVVVDPRPGVQPPVEGDLRLARDVDQDEARDLARVGSRERPSGHAAVRVRGDHDRRVHADRIQQRVELPRHQPGRDETGVIGAPVARPGARSVVRADPRHRRHAVDEREELLRPGGAEPALEHDRGLALAATRVREFGTTDVGSPDRRGLAGGRARRRRLARACSGDQDREGGGGAPGPHIERNADSTAGSRSSLVAKPTFTSLP